MGPALNHLHPCMQEDGVANAMASFHRQLPLKKLLAGERVEWDLTEPEVGSGVLGKEIGVKRKRRKKCLQPAVA